MSFVEFRLASDKSQERLVSVSLEHLAAVCAIDAKKTELMVSGDAIIVHGSYDEVTAKIRSAGS